MNRFLAMTFFLLVGVISAGELASGEKQSLRMGMDDSDLFVVESSDQWKVEVGEVLTLRYANVTVRQRDGDDIKLELRFLCDTPDLAKFDTPEKLRRGTAFTAKQFVSESVEKKVNLQEMPVKGRYGCYAVFTDASLNDGKPVAPGEWRYIRVGMVRLTNDSALAFGIYYNDEKDQAFIDGLAYLQRFVQTKIEPSTTQATAPSR